MTEYANTIVNLLIKRGLSKTMALKFAKYGRNIDIEEVITRANKLANDEDFIRELDKIVKK